MALEALITPTSFLEFVTFSHRNKNYIQRQAPLLLQKLYNYNERG